MTSTVDSGGLPNKMVAQIGTVMRVVRCCAGTISVWHSPMAYSSFTPAASPRKVFDGSKYRVIKSPVNRFTVGLILIRVC